MLKKNQNTNKNLLQISGIFLLLRPPAADSVVRNDRLIFTRYCCHSKGVRRRWTTEEYPYYSKRSA